MGHTLLKRGLYICIFKLFGCLYRDRLLSAFCLVMPNGYPRDGSQLLKILILMH